MSLLLLTTRSVQRALATITSQGRKCSFRSPASTHSISTDQKAVDVAVRTRSGERYASKRRDRHRDPPDRPPLDADRLARRRESAKRSDQVPAIFLHLGPDLSGHRDAVCRRECLRNLVFREQLSSLVVHDLRIGPPRQYDPDVR